MTKVIESYQRRIDAESPKEEVTAWIRTLSDKEQEEIRAYIRDKVNGILATLGIPDRL